MPEALPPLALVPVPIQPSVYTVSVSLVSGPDPNVAVAPDSSPNPVPCLAAVYPLALVALSVCPGVCTIAVGLPMLVFSLVRSTVLVELVALVFTLVRPPLALVDPSCVVDYHPESISLERFRMQLTSI